MQDLYANFSTQTPVSRHLINLVEGTTLQYSLTDLSNVRSEHDVDEVYSMCSNPLYIKGTNASSLEKFRTLLAMRMQMLHKNDARLFRYIQAMRRKRDWTEITNMRYAFPQIHYTERDSTDGSWKATLTFQDGTTQEVTFIPLDETNTFLLVLYKGPGAQYQEVWTSNLNAQGDADYIDANYKIYLRKMRGFGDTETMMLNQYPSLLNRERVWSEYDARLRNSPEL